MLDMLTSVVSSAGRVTSRRGSKVVMLIGSSKVDSRARVQSFGLSSSMGSCCIVRIVRCAF